MAASATPVPSDSDMAAALAVAAAYEDAWNRHDMHALGALFTEDAEWVNIVGMWWRDRAAAVGAHTAYHATMFRDTPMRVEHAAARALAPGVMAVVLTLAMGDFTTPDGRVMSGTHDRLSLVLVKRDGWWLIGHGHNTVIDPVAASFDPVNRGAPTALASHAGRPRS
jgi:uncharacterized protein (TIGR02246 family)